jgi:hypothetical protein
MTAVVLRAQINSLVIVLKATPPLRGTCTVDRWSAADNTRVTVTGRKSFVETDGANGRIKKFFSRGGGIQNWYIIILLNLDFDFKILKDLILLKYKINTIEQN